MTELLSDHFIKETARLDEKEISSVIYHNIFGYPLNMCDLIKWRAGKKVNLTVKGSEIQELLGFFYMNNNSVVYRRLMRENVYKEKVLIAKKAAKLIAVIPSVRFVGLTGALAMKNAGVESDIDLIIVTRRSTLWSTRAIVLLTLKLTGMKVRRFGSGDEKDKLCLNMWLDEGNLRWKGPKNIFTAHEMAQIVPLYNDGGVYEGMILKNNWVKDFWPNAFGKSYRARPGNRGYGLGFITILFRIFNYPLMKMQYFYMRGKRTNEVVGRGIALFHPVDWSDIVTKRLKFNTF